MNRQAAELVRGLTQREHSAPPAFEAAALYGPTEESTNQTVPGGKVYRIANETGTGQVTVYPVFTGIELYYNDMHLGSCNQDQPTAKNAIEINYCAAGRYECAFGENSCCYLAAGDFCIGSAMRKKSYSCFPLGSYQGITIYIELDTLLPEVRQCMELLSIDLVAIRRYVCEQNHCCILRAAPAVMHLFSELYSVCEPRRPGYIKLKTLELLLFLSDIELLETAQQPAYFNHRQVQCVKRAAALLTSNLTQHITIETLAKQVDMSPTVLKECFRGVYGTPVYAYLRAYRLQTAQKLLTESTLPVAEIAHRVGYENPNKFASAFKRQYHSTPTEYRQGVRLDR